MAYSCRSKTRGRWSNDREAILWAVAARCRPTIVEFPAEFAALDPETLGEHEGETEIIDLDQGRDLLLRKFKVLLDGAEVENDDPALALSALTAHFLAPVRGGLQLCCVQYRILWTPVGFQANDIVTLKKFSVGDDSWGPFAGYQIPAAPPVPATQRHDAEVCKENADCEKMKVGKLEFEKRVGGAGAAGRTIALGTIGDIETCKLQ